MIEFVNVSYTYDKGLPMSHKVLENISFKVEDGTVTAIMGHTGSGKSTLVQMLNALIVPDSGEIYIDDIHIPAGKKDIKRLRTMVGLVFQYPEQQLFAETVYKDIAFGPQNAGKDKETTDALVRRAMKLVGLSEKTAGKSPFELSGGEMRRAAIAGVIAMSPHIIVFDEPFAGLDPGGRREIADIIAGIHERDKKSIILFVTHSPDNAAVVADRILVLDHGRILMHGKKEDVFGRKEELIKAGLGVPKVSMLMNMLRDAGYPLHTDIYDAGSAADEIYRFYKEGNIL